MSEEIKQPKPAEPLYSHEQVKTMISIAHTTGWNNGCGRQMIWGDTSFQNLKEQLADLFNFKM